MGGDGKKELLTPSEVSLLLGMHEGSIRRGIRAGRVPARKINGRWFIARHDIIDDGTTSDDIDDSSVIGKRGRGRPHKTRYNFCPHCGKDLESMPADVSFCPWCGKVVR